MQRLGPRFVQQFQTHCSACNGQGEIIRGEGLCLTMHLEWVHVLGFTDTIAFVYFIM